MKILHWFREDLRLLDNPALDYAATLGQVVPIFVCPDGLGSASKWWLHHSLQALSQSLEEQGLSLVLLTGDPSELIPNIAVEYGVELITWNRVYSPKGVAQGQQLKDALQREGIAGRSFNAQLLIEPGKVLNKQGSPFKVFTPFWRHCVSQLNPNEVLSEPSFTSFEHQIESEPLTDWGLLPTKPNWAKGFEGHWQPGENGAQQRWQSFLSGNITEYANGRDIPSQNNTSLLSPHLAFGEISPKQLWHETHQAVSAQTVDAMNGNKFLAEIGWREFSRYLLMHFPELEQQSFNQRFEHFPWGNDETLITAWQQGQTGYPIVDAGMRELWHTGYMHNRVRMIVASFLTKHCLTHWQYGMEWFWDTLLDADIANNTASWQWVAGCGADAAPYFRIFNPILQGEKFDGQGIYIRQWMPELRHVPNKYIHKPWEADQATLTAAKVILGDNYPLPIVDHKHARVRALDAYQAVKNNAV